MPHSIPGSPVVNKLTNEEIVSRSTVLEVLCHRVQRDPENHFCGTIAEIADDAFQLAQCDRLFAIEYLCLLARKEVIFIEDGCNVTFCIIAMCKMAAAT